MRCPKAIYSMFLNAQYTSTLSTSSREEEGGRERLVGASPSVVERVVTRSLRRHEG